MKIGIVGAGVMGKLLAFQLVNAGFQITLFDANQAGKKSCSMTAAGLLTPAVEVEKANPLIFRLGKDALNQHWPRILSGLTETIYFRHLGSLLLAHPRDTGELTRCIHMISNKCQHYKVYSELTQAQIKVLEPELTQFNNGYYFPNEGQLDSQALLNSLTRYLGLNGVQLIETFVHAAAPRKIFLDNSIQFFDLVLDCRGLGAKTIFNDLRSIRGELIWLQAPAVNLQHPIRLLHPRYHLYIAPRPDHIYILGASEIETEDHSEISVRTTLELLSAAYYLHPSFSEARIVKTATHCRPTLINHLPKIKFNDGLIAINGLYRHGFLIAPTLADEILRYLSSGFSALQYPELWEKLNDNHSFE